MIDDIAKYKTLYDSSYKILKGIFRNLSSPDFEDYFQDAFIKKYEIFQREYQEARGSKEMTFLIHILRNEIKTQIKRDNARRKKEVSIDFQDDMDEKKIDKEIYRLISKDDITYKLQHQYIQDYLISDFLCQGLLTAQKIKENKNEKVLLINTTPILKRKAWVSENMINKNNFKEIVLCNNKELNSGLDYTNNNQISVMRIKFWVSCSKII